MFCDEKFVANGWSNTWINYGGMEENAASWPGYFWNMRFDYKVTKKSPDEVEVVLLRTEPKGISKNPDSLEKVYILKRGEAKLIVKNRMYNDGEANDILKLRTHPAMAVGGDATSLDIFFYPVGQTVKAIPYSTKYDNAFSNEGNWIAVFDTDKKKGVIQKYSKEDVGELYTYMAGDSYNFEITTISHEVASGAYFEFVYELGLLQGISGITGFGEDVGVNILLDGSGVYGKNEDVGFKIEISALSSKQVSAKVTIETENKKIVDISNFDLNLKPESSGNKSFKWNTANFTDGDYCIAVKIYDKSGNEILTVKKKLMLSGKKQEILLQQVKEFRERMEKTKKTYTRTRDLNLKQQIFKIAILLNQIEGAIQSNETDNIEKWAEEIKILLKVAND